MIRYIIQTTMITLYLLTRNGTKTNVDTKNANKIKCFHTIKDHKVTFEAESIKLKLLSINETK